MPQLPICKPATPLAQKLGLLPAKEIAFLVALLGEPAGFRAQFGDLPGSVHFTSHLTPEIQLAICFVRTLSDLHAVLALLAVQLPPKASVWIARPKQQHKPGFNENQVREGGLALGLVDYKICSFNDDWSGIKFSWRRGSRTKSKT